MANYDYKNGKKRIIEILDNDIEIIDEKKIPDDTSFTFENGYYGWVTGIFVDIRNSSELFCNENKEKVAKIIKCFTSEIIEILRLDDKFKEDDNLREIGIRGDCVYALYTTPYKSDIYELSDKTFYINTYIKMLNKLLSDRSFPTIKVGIGMSTAQELVIKAGRKNVGINNKVWIGKAVTTASNLSSIGNKNGNSSLVFSKSSYDNFIKDLKDKNKSENPEDWFEYHNNDKYGEYYTANIIKTNFNN